ncbi:MAG: tetratricopeptide repeat protein [Treponemataceae bacterium]
MSSKNEKNASQKKVREQIDLAFKAGVKRDYASATKILETLLITEGEFLKSNEDCFLEICLLLCRAFSACGKPVRAIFYGRLCIKSPKADSASFFFLGRAYLLTNDYRRAVICFEEALKIKPKNAEALAMLAYTYLKAKRTELAVSTFEKALELQPKNPKLNAGYLNALFVSAVKNFKNGSYELARQMFTFVINNGHDGVAPRLYLAHCLKGIKAYPEALTQYEAAIQFAPDDSSLQWYKALTLLQMQEFHAASEVLASVGLNIEGDSVTEQFLALGVVRQHIQKAEWSRAVVAGRLYTKVFGASTEMHMLIAEAQKNLGHIENALNHYSRALEIEGENPIIYYAIFELLSDNYRWDSMQKAIVNVEKNIDFDKDDLYFYKVITASHIDNPPEEVLPHLQALVRAENYATNYKVYNALGNCYVKLGLAEIAESWYKKTLNQNPKNEEAKIGLIACYEQLENNVLLQKSYAEYFPDFPSNTPLRLEYIDFLKASQNWSELVSQLEILAKLTKENKNAELAYALRKNGDYRRAALIYRDMLKSHPKDSILLHNLVYCLDKLGQTKIALNLLQLARQTFGENHDSMIIEGILSLCCNKKIEAIRLFQYVVEKEPKNEVAKKYLMEAKKY